MDMAPTRLALSLAMATLMPVFSLTVFSTTVSGQQTSETVATAAKKAFDKGAEELAAGNYTGAITLLKTAVRIQPESGQYHHKLAKAFAAAEKYHEMWVHLRKATVLDLSSKEYAEDFLRMWKYHDLQGTLNVGTGGDAILNSMGEPDKCIEDGTMKRWAYGFMAIDFGAGNEGKSGVFRVLDLRGYSAEAARELEQISVKTDSSKWKVAHHQVSRKDDNLELTLKDEQIQKWTELFSKQRFPLLSKNGGSVDGMLNSLRKSLKATNPDIEFTVVSQSPTEALYHWVTKATKDNAAQHEVAKIIKGQKDFYRVAYVKKTDRLTETELKQWLEVIGNAKLIPQTNTANQTTSQTKTTSGSANATATNPKLQAWELGKSLSFAALIRGKHGPDDVVKNTLMKVSENAQALDVKVPAPSKLTDDASADTAAAIQFLLKTAGEPMFKSLESQHGTEHAALFELATKSSLLMLLYQPGDSMGASLAVAIERSVKKAKLDQGVCKPLVDKINNKDTPAKIRLEVQQFQTRVAAAIK